MKKNSYIAGLKVLLGAAFVLSAVEQSKSMQPSSGVSAINADVIASSQLRLCNLISFPPEENDYYWSNGQKKAEILLNHGADVNTCDENGVSLLRLAIESRCLERVAFLLRHGADANGKDKNGRTLLHSIILSYDGPWNESWPQVKDGKSPRNSVWSENVIVFLVHGGHANINERAGDDEGLSPLHLAIELERLDIVKFWVNFRDVDINVKNYRGETPVHFAVKLGRIDTVKFLARVNGVDINAQDNWGEAPLHQVIRSYENTFANFGKKDDMLSSLLSCAGVNINAGNHAGVTPLLLAIKSGKNEVALGLIRHCSPNINQPDYSGKTPLHFAVESKSKDVIAALICKGANINTKTNSDNGEITPLHLAVKSGDIDIVNFLLGFNGKVDINMPDGSGKTPLHWAVELGHKNIVELLLNCRVNINLPDGSGKTPLDLADDSGRADIVTLLEARNAIRG